MRPPIFFRAVRYLVAMLWLLLAVNIHSECVFGQEPAANEVPAENAISERPDSNAEQLDPVQVAFFEDNVLPILKERCFSCHSHDQEISGNLALDFASGWKVGGDRGPAIVPGKPENSLLLQAVRGEIADLKMPPEESLSPEQISTLQQWITQGAIDPRAARAETTATEPWWSYLPIHAVTPPTSDVNAQHPIDAFLNQKIHEAGLTTNPIAERRTLLRRLMIDLHGVVPTSEELTAYQNDNAPDAYERVVDRLLASPHYGERWARHWFDWIHFADTHGFEHDVIRIHAWPYRDYVIQSLNADTPWDRWIQEQLAADAFFPNRTDLIPALGFLAAGPWDHSTAATAQTTFDYIDRDEMVTQVSSVLLSSTVHCSRCHNHKFDPIAQSDYYAMQAVFAGVGRGNVPFDRDVTVGARRQAARKLQQAAEARDASQLLTITAQEMVADWEQRNQQQRTQWAPLLEDMVLALEGTEIKVLDDHVVLATGPRPATETCIVTGHTDLSSVTGIRLQVFRDDSFPMGGPGRNDNGNLHLNEFIVEHLKEGSATPVRVPISQAMADFDQTGWTIAHAIDGNPSTAWGIFPEVGKDHTAVFQFATPLTLGPKDKLIVQLRQLHGGFHTIGKFRLTLSSDNNPQQTLLPQEVIDALAIPRDQRSDVEQLSLAAFVAKQQAIEVLNSLPSPSYVYATAPQFESLTESPFYAPWTTPKKVHLLKRGDIAKPADEAVPGVMSCLTHAPSRFQSETIQNEAQRRMELARWVTHSDNPLFWRSIVNRLWQHHFGRGLVDTPNDFGRMGSVPSHPELLDWLATELRNSGGSLKHIHRLIVTSEAYRRSSELRPEASSVDPDNRLIWRGPSGRLDAETFRDSLLYLARSLDQQTGGPAAQWFKLGPGIQITPSVDYTNFDWSQPVAHRRTIYRFVYRGIQDPFMEALDFPDAAQLTPIRTPSASPLQALALWNHDFVLYAANEIATYCRRQQADDPVGCAFRTLFLREPTEQERLKANEFTAQHDLAALIRVLINSNEFLTFR
ncbi:MAG: DUF1553 domain-containing protein [Candidatus Moraniibacteriota bacterium]|nr:MAG: DUF1553 domain-containing protein [Candidatus Moranbacteria bacterium]